MSRGEALALPASSPCGTTIVAHRVCHHRRECDATLAVPHVRRAAVSLAAAAAAMQVEEEVAGTIPPQYKPQPMFDLRSAGIGPRGFKVRNKRKLDEYEEQVRACFGVVLRRLCWQGAGGSLGTWQCGDTKARVRRLMTGVYASQRWALGWVSYVLISRAPPQPVPQPGAQVECGRTRGLVWRVGAWICD